MSGWRINTETRTAFIGAREVSGQATEGGGMSAFENL